MTALAIVLTGLLIALNAFFVVAEYALVRTRRARLEQDVEEGKRGASLALHQIDEINDYVSTIQVGITLTAIANRILRLLGTDPETLSDDDTTPEELKLIISQARAGGALDPGEAGMLSGVFHLHEQEARQVMTPTPAVVTIDISDDVETAL